MKLTLNHAKSLCTASELSLVKASTGKEIGKFSAAQLRQKIERSRKLRDKWKDQAEVQRRALQSARGARDVDAGARSAKKAQLFADVLARYQGQLAILESRSGRGPQAQKLSSKRTRSTSHRADRAGARAQLKEEKLALGGRKKSTKEGSARQQRSEPGKSEAGDNAATVLAKRRSRIVNSAAKVAIADPAAAESGLTTLSSRHEVHNLRTTKGKQLRARSAAKQSRLKASALLRVQTNATARNRRSQGKRDSR